jgi:hypothetical protein
MEVALLILRRELVRRRLHLNEYCEFYSEGSYIHTKYLRGLIKEAEDAVLWAEQRAGLGAPTHQAMERPDVEEKPTSE